MATPENTFIAAVHRHLPKDLYRMKNHNQYNAGIPDVWYSGKVRDLWIEYKFITMPKNDTTKIPVNLSALQLNWLNSRFGEGRQVAVIIGCKEGGVLLNHSEWNMDISTRWFKNNLRDRQTLASVINILVSHGTRPII